MRAHLLAPACAAALILAACHTDVRYHTYHSAGSDGWETEDTLTFRLYSSLTPNQYTLQLGVRHTGIYPYSDLWVALLHPCCEDVQPDTFHLLLTDGAGHWCGRGTESSSFQYESDPFLLTLSEPDTVLQVIHLMDTARLRGITDVGVKLTEAGQ